MLISDPEAPRSPSILKFAAAAAAMMILAGCAVTMPLRPLATSGHDSHFACRAGSKCSNETKHPVAKRRLKPIDDVRIDDDPPDFIVNGGSQVSIPE
jgi:hypothetical protein